MPASFVHLSPELREACRHGPVLTPTERLRRELVRGYDAWMAREGHRAWPSAEVFSIDGWFSHLYRRACAANPDLPRVIGATAELLLWESTAPDGHEALAPLARDAAALAWQWRIPFEPGTFGRTENGRLMLEWAGRVRRALALRGSITRAEVPARLREHVTDRPERLCCYGFESPARALTDHLDALAVAGTQVIHLHPAGPAARQTHRVELPDARLELAAAAEWCRHVLETRPDARIGVVVPDLARRHRAVLRQFAACLEPVGASGEKRVFDLAGGTSLASQPIWRDATRWLRFCFDRIPAAEVRLMLASRYLALPALPAFPSMLPESFGLRQLARATGDAHWLRIGEACPDGSGRVRLDRWLDWFRQALALAGWSGRGAGSVQFQAFEQAVALQGEAARARTHETPCNALAALTVIGRLARQRLFAPARKPAPVQILGYLETTGLHFTHLWITGLTDSAWPGAAHANPLLPLSTQREHGVPRIDARGELEFALRRLDSWRQGSEVLVCSHGVDDGDRRQGPSALVEGIAPTAPEALIPGLTRATHPALAASVSRLVRGGREHATPLTPGPVRGGSTLIADQALCPFRRWAVHTLGLTAPDAPHGFPDAGDRGALVHDVFYRALDRNGSPPGHPAELRADELDGIAGEVLAMRYQRFPAPVRELERQRLRALLRRWLEVEAARPEFSVAALEHEVSVTLAGLTLTLRFDRVDRIDGGKLVLDYKTGRTAPERLLDHRPAEPQLPLYALADPDIRGVLFVEVAGDAVTFKGAAADGLELPPARLVPLDGDWNAARERWRELLTALAAEIRRGRADVLPLGPEVCRLCHLQPFCRIHELARAPDAPASAAPDELTGGRPAGNPAP